jgi:hypothetical protein
MEEDFALLFAGISGKEALSRPAVREVEVFDGKIIKIDGDPEESASKIVEKPEECGYIGRFYSADDEKLIKRRLRRFCLRSGG